MLDPSKLTPAPWTVVPSEIGGGAGVGFRHGGLSFAGSGPSKYTFHCQDFIG
jgi:hypothetical protein